jgi:3-isopropylmalate/(R)-2-methylmalate dehydratase large subunit
MTMSQKILADHAGVTQVVPGELINARVDMVLGNDITTPVAISEFKKARFSQLFDPDKLTLILDHFTPNKDIKAAQQSKLCRDFAREQNLRHFFDVGKAGIEHALLPEQGLIASGELLVGADSHTCTHGALGAFAVGVGSTDMAAAMATGRLWFKVPSALKFVLSGKPRKYIGGKDIILHIIGQIGVDGARYKSMEFTGEGLRYLSMDDRFAIANMAVEAGAKNGIFEVDAKTTDYMKNRVNRPYKVYSADPDACYEAVYEIDLSALRPTVAFPHLPENIKTPEDFGEIPIDQVVIGSCTNGRLEDLRVAAEVLNGKQVAPGVRVIIIPATQQIYRDAMHLGYLDIFLEAGCAVSTPTCGPCLGGHTGVLAKGERASPPQTEIL